MDNQHPCYSSIFIFNIIYHLHYYNVQTDYPAAHRRTSEHVTLDKKPTLTNAERKKLKALREGLSTRRLVNKLICTAWKLEYDTQNNVGSVTQFIGVGSYVNVLTWAGFSGTSIGIGSNVINIGSFS